MGQTRQQDGGNGGSGHRDGVIASTGGSGPSQIDIGDPQRVLTFPIPYLVGYQVWHTLQSQATLSPGEYG